MCNMAIDYIPSLISATLAFHTYLASHLCSMYGNYSKLAERSRLLPQVLLMSRVLDIPVSSKTTSKCHNQYSAKIFIDTRGFSLTKLLLFWNWWQRAIKSKLVSKLLTLERHIWKSNENRLIQNCGWFSNRKKIQ